MLSIRRTARSCNQLRAVRCMCVTTDPVRSDRTVLLSDMIQSPATDWSKIRVFSGIQPTGVFHLGNYLGALRNWKAMQDAMSKVPASSTPRSLLPPHHPYPPHSQSHPHSSSLFFSIVDLHSITVPQTPSALRESILQSAATVLACGLDPTRCTLFQQSRVPEHAELTWILGCLTPLGWLRQMTQFKAKAEKQRDAASLGLLSYPVLMAADILLYQATHVPVGDDQLQHLELTRDIAHAVNAKNPTSHVFTIPTVVYSAATRVMSLRDGRAKMSKSDESDQSRINLLDDADTIRKKIRRAKTDSQTELSYDEESRPEVANLLRIFAELRAAETGAPVSVGTIVDEYRSRGNAAFKDALADVVVASVDPVRSEYLRWMADRSAVSQVLDEGARRAREHATLTMERVKSLVGFQ